MNNIMEYVFEENEIINTLVKEDGTILFLAKDVCGVLEFKNVSSAIKTHVPEADIEKQEVSLSGQRRKQNFINESGLYALIMGSKKDAAQRFKKWVTGEVLPAIRNNGNLPTGMKIPKTFSEALFLAAEQAKKLEQVEVKVVAYDHLLEAGQTFTFEEACRFMGGISAVKLEEFCLANLFVYRLGGTGMLMPKEEMKDKGYFDFEDVKGKGGSFSVKTLITTQGIQFLRPLVMKHLS